MNDHTDKTEAPYEDFGPPGYSDIAATTPAIARPEAITIDTITTKSRLRAVR